MLRKRNAFLENYKCEDQRQHRTRPLPPHPGCTPLCVFVSSRKFPMFSDNLDEFDNSKYVSLTATIQDTHIQTHRGKSGMLVALCMCVCVCVCVLGR